MTTSMTRQRVAGWARAATSEARTWPGAIASTARRWWARASSFAWRHPALAWSGAGVLAVAGTVMLVPVLLVAVHVYGNRANLPDPGPFVRFEFLATGHVYDANGHPLIELAREHRIITRYEDIPQVVRNAVVSTEDKRFFSHNGVDYQTIPRVLARIRVGTLAARMIGRGPAAEADAPAIFPQGGSTITQQLVRGYFLKGLTSLENSPLLQGLGWLPRSLSFVLGGRNANMIARKAEEMRLSLWLEDEMARQFGSKRRAKEEILARYASYVYMGGGQYGFATAAQHYFGAPLTSIGAGDADRAALLAGIPKSPRDYAPTAVGRANVLRRRNQTLTLMEANGFLTGEALADAIRRPLPVITVRPRVIVHAASAVGHVIKDLKAQGVVNGLEDLLQGRLDVHSTVDIRVQEIVNAALEHGLAAYEQRHPRAVGLTQGSVVVLGNGDGRILAEAGGRPRYNGRAVTYSDFNRAIDSARQPGSAMKPIAYLAAFRSGDFDLNTLVPDEPISIPDGANAPKWISNYDGRFKGRIPVRQALAESRNAAAMWIGRQIGIDTILTTARRVGVATRLYRYPTTILGASEVTLMELANAYRTMASGVYAETYLITAVERAGTASTVATKRRPVVDIDPGMQLIQEGLRGVVRMPAGTAHALDSTAFPIPIMGKTGTTNDFRDALFVGSTYGAGGITVAVRVGFDDNRSLGANETGGRLALPIFREVMTAVYGNRRAGPMPVFPASLEASITAYLEGGQPAPAAIAPEAVLSESSPPVTGETPRTPTAEWTWLLANGAR
jgi:penicillin-binding protein 1A